jgi:MFS family permease
MILIVFVLIMENDKRSIVAIALITAICLTGDSMLYIVLPTQWKLIGLGSIMEVGILLSINRFIRLPLNPLIGLIYTKINLRNGILIAVLIGGITTLCYGYVSDFHVWVILRSLWGITWSLFKLGAYLIVIQLSDELNRGKYMGTYNGLYRIGSLFGMLIGGFFADFMGLKVITNMLGVMALLSIPFIYLYIPNNLLINKEVEKKSIFSLKVLNGKNVIGIFVTSFLIMMILDSMFTASLSHLIELKIRKGEEIFGLVMGAASIAGTLQGIRWLMVTLLTPKMGAMLDQTSHKGYVLALYLIPASFIMIIVPLNLQFELWVSLLLVHLIIASFLTNIVDVIVTDQVSTFKNNKILFMSSYTLVLDLGAAFGPILGFMLEELIGINLLYWISSVLFFLLGLMWIFPSKVYIKKQKENSL